MGSIKKTKYLGIKKNSKEDTNPDDFCLDGVENPHSDKDYVIRFSSRIYKYMSNYVSARFWLRYS